MADDLVKKSTDNRIAQIDRELEAHQRRSDQIRALGDMQNQDVASSLAFEEKALAESELKKEKTLRRQKLLEAGVSGFKLLALNIDKGDKQPLVTTLAEITQLIAAIPTFITGTGEKDVAEVLGKPQLQGQDGYIIRVDGNEKILNPKQSDEYDKIMSLNVPQIKQNSLDLRWQSNEALLNEVKNLTEIMKNKREYLGLDFDPLQKALIETTKKANTKIRTHIPLDM